MYSMLEHYQLAPNLLTVDIYTGIEIMGFVGPIKLLVVHANYLICIALYISAYHQALGLTFRKVSAPSNH